MNAISLFTNCGAGDIGFSKAGFKFSAMAELITHRLDVALLNHKNTRGFYGDIRETADTIVEYYQKKHKGEPLSLLAACPPCQGMSSASGTIRDNNYEENTNYKNGKNLLVLPIINIAKKLRPHVIVIENVPQFLTRKILHPNGKTPITAAKLICDELESLYEAYPIIIDIADYGTYQTRKRCFITFIRKNTDIITFLKDNNVTPYPIPTRSADYGSSNLTFKDFINKYKFPALDSISAEQASKREFHDLHFVPVWIERTYKMVSAIPPKTGGSAWENNTCFECQTENTKSAVKCKNCKTLLLKPVVKNKNGSYRLISGFNTSYKRIPLEKPSSTILTASGNIGSHSTIHPIENRVLSPIECQLLQTIPKNFKWGNTIEKYGVSNLRAMIGEAVPPLFTQKHGKVLMKLLTSNFNGDFLSNEDKRVKLARKKLSQNTLDIL